MKVLGLLFLILYVGCGGEKDNDAAKRSLDRLTQPKGENAEAKQGTSNQAEHNAPDQPEPEDTTRDEESIRLLRPDELKTKTRGVFNMDWNVPGTRTNGFDQFASSLNGIDYETVEDYPKTVSTMYISTHEKFCRELSADSFRQNTFFTKAARNDRHSSEPEKVEDNLLAVMTRLTTKVFGKDDREFQATLRLLKKLEAAAPADLNNRHPLELVVYAICFTSPFVHNM